MTMQNLKKKELKELSEPEPETIATVSLAFAGQLKQQSLTAIAQLHLTYIVCVDHHGSIILIDQHAADERIRYESHLNLIQSNRHASVPLIPIMIDVKPSDAKLLTTERLQTLASLGLLLEPFGANAFKVNQIPTWALEKNPQVFVEDLLMQIFEEKIFPRMHYGYMHLHQKHVRQRLKLKIVLRSKPCKV